MAASENLGQAGVLSIITPRPIFTRGKLDSTAIPLNDTLLLTRRRAL